MRSIRAWTLLAFADAVALGVGLGLVLLLRGGEEARRPVAARPTIVQDDAQVLHRSTAEVRRTVRGLRDLGVDWLRVTANWSFIAPQPEAAQRPEFDAADPAAYPPGAWAKLDRAVRVARAADLEVMIDVAFWAPRWATTRPSPEADRQRDGIDAREFGRFAEAVARRYGDRAVAYTIWNEPNYQVFLRPQWRRAGYGWEVASAGEYRRMVYDAAPRIRRHAPEARVLIGGTAALGTSRPRTRTDPVPPLRFLRELACVDSQLRPVGTGACAGFRPLPGDGWAHHPYSPRRPPAVGDPEPDTAVVADQGRLADLLDRLAAAGRTEQHLGLWDTEFGYETDPPDPTHPVTLADQARWLPEAEALALADPRVRAWAQFLYRDLPERPGATAAQRWGDFQSGLELQDAAPKPAMRSFAYPLAVRRAGPGAVAVWGRVRPGTGARRVRVLAGPLILAEVQTRGDGTFTFTRDADRGAVFRMEVRRGARWVAVGLPVPGAGLKRTAAG
jgi:Cellulase (glycosyl hydrolase family 5)